MATAALVNGATGLVLAKLIEVPEAMCRVLGFGVGRFGLWVGGGLFEACRCEKLILPKEGRLLAGLEKQLSKTAPMSPSALSSCQITLGPSWGLCR